MRKGIFEKVYWLVRQIPQGKVTTYGLIAEMLGIGARTVGWALHANRDRVRPCHRVVSKEGRLAPGYALGGPKEQKRKLLAEGVKFKDESHVDLEKHLWQRLI